MLKRDVITTKIDLKDFLSGVIKESLHSTKKVIKEDEEKEALKTGDVSVEEVIDKLNTIRAGKSFKSEEIKSAMESYLNDLNSAEKTALFAFLKGISQVVGGEVEGSKAVEPQDSPANVKMEKKPSSQKVTVKPVVIKKPEAQPGSGAKGKEDTTPPVPIAPKKK
jgi:hypothetical protein